MSKNKITFTAQRAKFLLAILVTSLITGMAFFWPPMLTQAQGTTPESCFSFYNGTISYYFDTNPNCPSNVVIPEKIRGQTVKKIQSLNNRKITSVTIPNSVAEIADYAFQGNLLTSIIIPNSITSIGNGVFSSNNLTSVSIPDSVTTIGNSAFSLNNLTSVSIPDSVTTIGNSAFSSNNLTSVSIPDSVTTIGNSAFRNNQLTSIIIPDSITYIDSYTFIENPGLEELNRKVEGIVSKNNTNITLGSNPGITIVSRSDVSFNSNGGSSIDPQETKRYNLVSEPTAPIRTGYDFAGWYKESSLKNKWNFATDKISNNNITLYAKWIPQTYEVTFINCNGFVESLQNINYGNSAYAPTYYAPNGYIFQGWDKSFHYITTDLTINAQCSLIEYSGDQCFLFDHNTILSYNAECGPTVTIPSSINGETVLELGDQSFRNAGITAITLPDTLQSIGKGAFVGNKLTSIEIPNSIEYIGSEAFMNNISYNPDYLTEIEAWIDIQIDLAIEENCSGLSGNEYESCKEQVTIELEDYIEQNFLEIYALYLVDVVHYYSNYDQVLAEVMQPVKGYINKSPRTIMVEEDAYIEFIVNTNPGETTPEYCFWIENNVIDYYHPACGKDVNIPSSINGETVLGIGDYIFAEHGLTSVTLPNSLLAIGEGAFGANELKSIVIPNSVNDIGNHAFSSNNLESVVLPNSLTHIGYGTFSMNNITSINLPETLESIDSKAFEANIIYIPEYVEYVDNAIQEAIEYCLENPGSRGASNPQQCPQIIQQQIETMGGYKGVYVNILEASYGPEIFSEIMPLVKGYISQDPSSVQVAADAYIELIETENFEGCFYFEEGTVRDYAETCPRDMVIPNTIGGTPVTRIGEGAFGAMELTSVLIPQGIIDIGTGAFFDNQIKTIILPAGLQELGAYAFYQNELENVSSSGPLALTEIKYETFANNYLTALGIPDGISIIGDGAFQNNDINTLTLPESLQIIGDSAFQNNSIKNITFPKNLTELGVSAFADNEIEIIYINEIPPLNKISASAFRNNKLTNGGVPGSITIIEDFAFAENLFQNLTIAEGVQQIGTGAFLDNNLSSIHLPDSIESIASGAFAGNPGVPKYAGKVEGSINKNPASVALAPNANLQWTYNYTVTFNSNGAANIPNQTINYGSQITPPAAPSKAGFDFAGWYSDAGLTQARDFATPVNSDLTLYAKWEKSFVPSDIQLTAEITAANQTVRINKYFSNAYTVNRGDGSTETVNTDKTHTYATAGDYTITLSLAGTASRWTFGNVNKPLVPKAETTASNIYLSSMPSLADYFGTSATSPGGYFFRYFNHNGALTSLPEGSFNTSNITTAGFFFFRHFNYNGALTSLPAGSFDTSKITTAGTFFFSSFNQNGALTALPEGSFDTSKITTAGNYFFSYFNQGGALIRASNTGVAIKNPSSSAVTFDFKTPAGGSSSQRIAAGSSFQYYATAIYTVSFTDHDGTVLATQSVVLGDPAIAPVIPIREGYGVAGWYTDKALTQVWDFATPITTDLTLYAKWEKTDIQLTAEITTANQTVKINKYFSNTYSVDRGDGSPIVTLTADTTHTYTAVGEYQITLSLTGTATRWTFGSIYKPLVPKAGTTANNIYLSSMPSLADYFGTSATSPGNRFFSYFNAYGALSSLPEGSFDTSKITTVGDHFFGNFNISGELTSLPEGSFDTSKITTVGNDFFNNFNAYGALSSLPEGSFDTSKITTVGDHFFGNFNISGELTSLPEGSFDTSKINTVGEQFFSSFNANGALTSLPVGSFNTSKITTVGTRFFNSFNSNGALTSLPEGSFDTSKITIAGDFFFSSFNSNGGKLTSLPEGSFDTSKISTVGDYFFRNFNNNGLLTSLPEGSFDTSKITIAGDYFFSSFNANGALTSLPAGSFDTSNITTAGNSFFYSFNSYGALTSLPAGSFDTSKISTVGDYFFRNFNNNGLLTSLPEGSFDTSKINTVGEQFFSSFNANGALTSLPVGSFNTSKITTVGNRFFNSFNSNGALTSLPEGSFDTSKITIAGDFFFEFFNSNGGKLTSLPEGSFDTSKISTVGHYFFRNFNNNGLLTSLPEGSFDTSNITTVGTYFFYYFNKDGALTTLPENSFDTSNIITSVRNDFFNSFNYNGALIRANNTGVAIKNPSSSAVSVSFYFKTPSGNSSSQSIAKGSSFQYYATAIDSVSFQDHDGTVLATQSVAHGDFATAPTDPTRAGYAFGGWYSDAGLTQARDFATPVTSDLTLYAKWLSSFTVSFESNGGSPVADQTVHYANTIQQPTPPTKIGHSFAGWYKESGLTTAWDFATDTMPANDITLYAKWNINSYTVTFKDHDATILKTQTVNHGSDATAPTDPTRVGYSFAGWDKTYHNITADTTVTATYTTNTYTISYHLDAGTNHIDNPSSYTIETNTISLQSPTKTGYTFTGWYDAASGGNKITAIAKGSTGDKTLYARWTINKYDVNFESNGGSPVVKQTLEYNATVSEPSTPSKEGHSFAGWYKNENLTTAWNFSTDKMPANDLTLYAKWTVNSYQLSFDSIGGSAVASKSVNYGTTTTTPATPSKNNASFGGWYRDTGYTTAWNFATDTMPAHDLTLYAKWSYVVNFEVEGGSAIANQSIDHGKTASRPANPIKTGYTFDNWYSTSEKLSLWNFATPITAKTTIYAKWNPINYTITYHLDGGTNDPENPNSYTIETATITLKDPSKLGYTFEGWYDTLSGGNKITSIPKGSTGNKKLYARWTINQYKVNFDTDGGTPIASQNIDYQGLISEPTPPNKTGHIFIGWYKESELTTTWDFATDRVPANEITLYAKWIKQSYTVNFESNGGTPVANLIIDYQNLIPIPASPNKIGHSFLGWFKDESLSNAWDFDNDLVTSDLTLYAKWQINSYTVNFESNGGSAVATQTINYGNKITQPTTPNKTGHTFLGWFKDENLTSAWDFENGLVTTDLTLYAKWQINSYTVSYESNGGNAIPDQEVVYATKVIQPTDPVRMGYQFEGRFREASFSSSWDFENDLMPANNIILYAKRSIKTYTISYENLSGMSHNNPTSYTIISPVHLLAPNDNPVGYHFTGWYDQLQNGNQISIVSGTENRVLYARWEINTYTVEFKDHDGSTLTTQIVKHGDAASTPTDPSREGYTFIGWDKEYDHVTGDMTINAQYQINSYILSFDAQGGTAIPNQTVVYATKATKPTNPTKTGYNFDAWYQDSNLTILWNFANDTMPAHDVTLYAKWIPIIYTINYFGLEDGTHNNPATFTIEDLPVALENANRIGYTFTGWFDHTTEGNQLENITTIGNLSLYARWQINSYTLNFESNGGTSLESISVTFKDKIIQPADPINTGNTLVGWFKDAGFTQERKFASDTMPANDITLYAQWKYGTHPKCFDFTSSTKTITNYKKDAYPECGPVVAIPDTINNYNVENIGSNALQGKTIHTLTLSGTLKIIGNHAFANNDLTTLRIPNSVTNIGNNTFAENKLNAASIGNNVQSIGSAAFSGNQIKTLTLPNSISYLGESAFINNQITTLNLPNTLTNIQDQTFANNKISAISIPDSIVQIGKNAFSNNQISTLSIGSGTQSIKDHAFQNNKIQTLHIPENITSLGRYAFAQNQIDQLSISGSITSFAEGIFAENKLSYISIDDAITVIENEAFRDNLLTGIQLSQNLISIGNYAFSGNALTSLFIPDSLTNIGIGGFIANPGLTKYQGKVEGVISKNPNTISLGENHNIQLAPSLLISYQNEDGETLAPDKLIWNYGENNEKVFERGKNYIIKPIKHTNLPNTADRSIYLTPQYQRAYFVDGVEYPRIIFIYETPKLLFHYDFNEEDDAKINLLRDMSEPSLHNPINHGTSYGAPTREGRGRIGGSYVFEKLSPSNYHYLAPNSNPAFSGNGQFSLALWYQYDSGDMDKHCIISNSIDNNGYQVCIKKEESDQGIKGILEINLGDGTNTTTLSCNTIDGTDFLDENWHHIIASYDMVADSPNLTCYIDGKSEGSQTIQTIPETMKLDNLSLGAGNKNLRDNSKIVVDDLRVYNYAFNSIQAWNLYESYPPIDIYDFCRLSQTKKANPEITEEECKALIDLYVNTDGKNRTQKNGWEYATKNLNKNTEFEICKRTGITCEEDKVTKIDLSKNQLNGTLTGSFVDLINLKELDLSKNSIGGSTLSQLRNLEKINLSQNHLQLAIPNNFFSNNTGLIELNLANNQIAGMIPNNLNTASNLEILNLSHNQLQGKIPSALTELKKIKKAFLNNNYLVGELPRLDRLKETITTLNISNNYIANIDGKAAESETNRTIIHLLGEKIIALPQRELIVAQYSSNFGYTVNKFIKNLLPNRTYPLYIGKRSITSYQEDGTPIYKNGMYQEFENPSIINFTRTPPALFTRTTGLKGNLTISSIPQQVGNITWYINGENQKYPNEGATFSLQVYPNGIEPENELYTGTNYNTGTYNSGYYNTGGLSFQLESQYLKNSFSPVHFSIAGNDFGGGFFWTEATDLPEAVIISTKDSNGDPSIKKCLTRVNGFYYNSQRGERLRPLDSNSLDQLKNTIVGTNGVSYDDLELSGGFYTNCSNDIYGIYGSITHTYQEENHETKTYKLNAGIAYNMPENKMKSEGLQCNFQRLNNQYPFGYVYDENGHIGFVGAKIKNNENQDAQQVNNAINCAIEQANTCISNLFYYENGEVAYKRGSASSCEGIALDRIDFEYGDGSAAETMFRLGIRGIIGLSSDVSQETKKEIVGNTLEKSILMETEESIATVINTARKNADQLCRNRWNSSTLADVLCYDLSSNLVIPDFNFTNRKGKTVIVKNGDVVITQAMSKNEAPINLFIDRGNLYLKNPESTGNLQDFDAYGFPTDGAIVGGAKANYLKGNFIINGLIMGTNDDYGSNTVPLSNKRYINGKIASYNTYGDAESKRIDVLRYILGDHWDEDRFKEYINLESIFQWKCSNLVQGIGSDGTSCRGIGASDEKGEMTSKAFGLIDFYYSNPLFK